MNRGFRIAHIAGIDVFIDWSLLIIFLLITFSLGAGLFPSWHPAWNPAVVWSTAVAAGTQTAGMEVSTADRQKRRIRDG